jgi:glycosyltransferase involved in cell wall biosynthesis
LLPLFVRNAFRLLIFDIYPDVLTELDYLTDRALLTRFWKALNRKAYDRALKVFTITEGMGIVLEKYVGKDAIEIIPLWTDNSFLKPVKPQDNFFIEEHHLSGKFVVLYSGNIGLATKIDSLIDVANEIGREDVVFLIIGEGSKKTLISERIKELSLKNVILLPWQHYTNLPYSLSSASLAVISLGSGNSQLFVPSKLYNFLSVGAPLLCISSAGSEIERMAEKYQCGRNFEPDDLRGMILFINDLADNPEMHLRMKENSLTASKEFSDDNAKRYLSGI